MMGLFDQPIQQAPTSDNPDARRAAVAQIIASRISQGQGQQTQGQPQAQQSQPQAQQSQQSLSSTSLPPTNQRQVQGPKSINPHINPTSPFGLIYGGIHSLAVQGKQKKFEREQAEGALVSAGVSLKQRQDNGEKLSPQEQEILKQYILFDGKTSKASKIAEQMVLPDSGSGYYSGAMRFNQQEQQRREAEEARQQAIAKQQADIVYRQLAGQAVQTKAITGEENAATKAADEKRKEQIEKDKPILQDMKQNFMRPQIDPNTGNLMRSQDGTLLSRPMTMEDIRGNSELEQRYAAQKQKIEASVAKVREEGKRTYIEEYKARSGRISAEANMLRAQKSPTQEQREALKKLGGGGAIQNRLHTLAGMANDYLGEMKTLATEHPKMFGPSGLFETKLEQVAGDVNNPDYEAARQYIKLSQASSLPLAGIHNMRSQVAVKGIEDTLKSQWQSPQSALDGIKIYQDTAQKVINGDYSSVEGYPKSGGTSAKTLDKTSGGSDSSKGGASKGGSITIGQGQDAVTITIPK